MRKLLLASAATIGLVGYASAADLRMPVKAPPVVAPVFSWTGCYIGGFAGGAWSEGNTDVVTTLDGVVVAGTAFGYGNDSSFIAGGTLGCNYQPVGSPIVLGIEGEGGYLHLDSTGTIPGLLTGAGILGTAAETRLGDWYALVTGRVGYAWDRTLIYAKGGVAFVDTRTSVVSAGIAAPAFAAFGLDTRDTLSAWTVGGGIEWAFDLNWSVKAEYMFIGLDRSETVFVTTPGVGTLAFTQDLPGIHTAKVGLNYRFGGGLPVVARY